MLMCFAKVKGVNPPFCAELCSMRGLAAQSSSGKAIQFEAPAPNDPATIRWETDAFTATRKEHDVDAIIMIDDRQVVMVKVKYQSIKQQVAVSRTYIALSSLALPLSFFLSLPDRLDPTSRPRRNTQGVLARPSSCLGWSLFDIGPRLLYGFNVRVTGIQFGEGRIR